MVWLVLILALLLIQAAAIIILEYMRPSKAVAWLLILFIFPIIGFVMYYFFAADYSRRRKVEQRCKGLQLSQIKKLFYTAVERAEAYPESLGERLKSFLQSIPDMPLTDNNVVQVLYNAAETYDSMLEDIEQAEDHIHVEYYTIRSDEIGYRFMNALKQKAEQGLKVRLIYDGIGSRQLKKEDIESMKNHGVEVVSFLPPRIAFLEKRLNYRNHRKLVVVDGRIGYLGGINIGEEYLGADSKLGFWRDTHLRLQGGCIPVLQSIFMKDWALAKGELLDEPSLFPLWDLQSEEIRTEKVQLIASGPDMKWDSIIEFFFSSIATAKESIRITTPYFIPDPSLVMALKTAALCGLDVEIIIPKVSDSMLVHWASLSYVEELLQAGVKFYEYERGFIHSKVLIVDRCVASIGTANMDMRSFFSNFELVACIFDPSTIQVIEKDFEQDLLDCELINLDEFRRRPATQKIKEMVGRMLSPLL